MIMIRVFIIDSTTIPKNDPGIVIYWLCCLKFGQRGKYSEEYKMKQVKKNLYELKEFKSVSGMSDSTIFQSKYSSYQRRVSQNDRNKNMKNLYRNNRNLQNLAEKLNISILNIKDVDQFEIDQSESNIDLI